MQKRKFRVDYRLHGEEHSYYVDAYDYVEASTDAWMEIDAEDEDYYEEIQVIQID